MRRLAAAWAWLGYQWWWLRVHALGGWKHGPLGYLRMRRQLDRFYDSVLARAPKDAGAWVDPSGPGGDE